VQKIRNVIFDLGGVLPEWQPTKILARCYPDLVAQDAMRNALFRHDDWLAFNRGDITEANLITNVCRRTKVPTAEVVRVLDTYEIHLSKCRRPLRCYKNSAIAVCHFIASQICLCRYSLMCGSVIRFGTLFEE
jgi:hypothetical protein